MTVTPEGHFADLNNTLIDKLLAEGALHSPRIEHAFRHVYRHHFLPQLAEAAYRDEAIVTHQRDSDEWISSSSQPAIMAIMLEQLQVGPGMRVLEIGAGTGFNAALLAELTQSPGDVWTVDIEAQFCAEAAAHLAAAGKGGVHVVCGDGWQGWPEPAPFDRIIVTASAYDIAPAWFDQLNEGGIIVLPWGLPTGMQRSLGFRKAGTALIQQSDHTCGFMKMRGAHGWIEKRQPDTGEYRELCWSDPFPTASGTELDDLSYFLSLFLWPLSLGVYWQDESSGTDQVTPNRKIGLMDRGRRIITSIETGPAWKIRGTGDQETWEALARFTRLWHEWGRPSPGQLSLTAYRSGSVRNDPVGLPLARREWFDYAVTRTGTMKS